MIFLYSCEDDLAKNPTLTSPISALEITVSGIDYTVVPRLNAEGNLDNTMLLTVRIPNEKATIKSIHCSNGLTANVKEGDIVTFVDDILPITLSSGKSEGDIYYIKMDYTEPPVLYFVKSSDKDADGNGYYLDTEKSQTLASLNADDRYEGFIDLTNSNWDNICLVASDLKTKYETDGGWWPERSSGSFTLSATAVPEPSNYYSSLGPWAEWIWTNDNPQIVSPGIWKFDFNVASGELNLVETQWAIKGSSLSTTTAMVYNPKSRKWNIEIDLKAGDLRFVTIPVTEGDPVLSYGELGSTAVTGYIESQGKDIVVEEAGKYSITLDFSKSPYYTYSITKK